MSADVETDKGANLAALEERLAAVEKLQAVNLPKFLNSLRRLAKVEKMIAANTVSISALKAGFDKDAELRATNAQKLDEILSLMTYTKSGLGLLRKHGPKLLTFIVGVGIARGWIAAENGQSFLSIFAL